MSSAVYQNQTSPRGRVLAWLFCAERSNSPVLSQARLDQPQMPTPRGYQCWFSCRRCRGQMRSLYLRRPLVRKSRVLPLSTQSPGLCRYCCESKEAWTLAMSFALGYTFFTVESMCKRKKVADFF